MGEAGQVFGRLGLCLQGKAGCDPGFYDDDGIDGGVGLALPIPLLCDQFIIKMSTLQEQIFPHTIALRRGAIALKSIMNINLPKWE